MAELFEAVASWQTLLLALLVFGFAPGFVLRLLVHVYPRSDPRRRELISELYAVPRIQRPLWVAEQLEVALFEGLAHRASATIRSLTRQRRARTLTKKRSVRVGLMERATVVLVVIGIVSGLVSGIMVVIGAVDGAATWGAVLAVVGAVVQIVGLRTERRRFSVWVRRHSRPR